MIILRRSLVLTGLAIAACSQATLVNGSFEAPAVGKGVFNSTIAGWSQSSAGSGVWDTRTWSSFTTPPPDGLQVGYINSGGVAQVSDQTFQVGTNSISLFVGRRNDGFTGLLNVAVTAGGSASNGAVVGGTSVASLNVAASDVTAGQFKQFIVTVDLVQSSALVGKNIGIALSLGSGSQVDFDKIEIGYQAVPEPVSMFAIGTGLFAILRRKKR